ncbi:MAG TPA: RDD family protein [Gaiellaceae bacterium]
MEWEDRLSIATPEGVEVSLTLAGAASRFVSALVDLVIQILILLAFGLVLGIIGTGIGLGGFGIAIWFVVWFLVIAGYDIFFEVLNGGRTPGKMMNGLRVVRVQGHPVGFLTSAIRNFLRPIDFLPSAYLLGAILILATRKNQRIGDIAAGTLVVRELTGDEPPLPRIGAAYEPAERPYASWDTSRITAEELATVRQFLARRHDIDQSARFELAETLAERLRPKITGAPAELRGERFLEALVAAKSARG